MPALPDSCDEARWALWPDPEAPGPADARAHYQRCPACRRFFALDRELAGRLGRLRRADAPRELRDRVCAGVARARPAPRPPRLVVGALAVAAALVLAVLARDGMREVVAPFAAEARGLGPATLTRTTADAAVLGGWFAAALGSPITVPLITGAQLVGGKVAVLGGRPAAVVLYHLHGDPLAYFALPHGDLGDHAIADDAIRMAAAADVEVAVWRERGEVRAVAAAMPRAEVMAVATECRNRALMTRP